MRIGVLVSAAVLAASAAPALAGIPVAGVSVDGAPSPEAAAALTDSVVTAAGGDAKRAPGTCATPQCAATVLTGLGAPRGLVVTIAVSGEFHDRFAVAATVVDDQGRALRRRREDCATCTMAEAAAKAGAVVTATLDAADDDPVAVAITTTPVAAAVAIDGGAPVPTPWSGTLTAGPHTLVAGTTTQAVFVEASAETVALEVTVAVKARPRSLLRYAPYALAGGGAIAIAGGVYLIAVDGDPTCAHPTCPEVRDTGTGGWLLTGVGVVALGAAGYLYWRDRHADRPMLAVVPTLDGGAAALAVGRF